MADTIRISEPGHDVTCTRTSRITVHRSRERRLRLWSGQAPSAAQQRFEHADNLSLFRKLGRVSLRLEHVDECRRRLVLATGMPAHEV